MLNKKLRKNQESALGPPEHESRVRVDEMYETEVEGIVLKKFGPDISSIRGFQNRVISGHPSGLIVDKA